MKIFLVVVFLLSNSAMASSYALFGDETKAVIVVQGDHTDVDAQTLYKKMNVSPAEVGGRLVKTLKFTSKDGEDLMSLGCHLSQHNPDFGSCTMEVFKSSRAQINKSKREILLDVQNAVDVQELAALIQPADPSSGLIFLSSDDRMEISLDLMNDRVIGFQISYLE